MYYIRGILRNRVYCNEQVCMLLMRKAHKLNIDLEDVETLAKECVNWTEWRTALDDYINDCSEVNYE